MPETDPLLDKSETDAAALAAADVVVATEDAVETETDVSVDVDVEAAVEAEVEASAEVEVTDDGENAVEAPDSVADEVLLHAVDLARAALLDFTSRDSIGGVVGHVVEGEHILTLLFECNLSGYPGWHWAVSLSRLSDELKPTVLESELIPGEGALLAPEWVPWSDRLADYQAAQLIVAHIDEHDDEHDDDHDDDDHDDDDHDYDGHDDESDDDEDDDESDRDESEEDDDDEDDDDDESDDDDDDDSVDEDHPRN